jgi:FAD synthase
MQVISWEEYLRGDQGSGIRDQGIGKGDRNSDNDVISVLFPNTSNNEPQSPLALTIGVFDGVHRGHQALIQRICSSESPLPSSHSSLLTPHSSFALVPTVVTFRQNPLAVLKPDAFTGDILTLEQKLRVLEASGVLLTVLIDFSEKFSTIKGRDFVDLLLACRPVRLITLGRNFRCGCGLDTGADEIQRLAGERGVEVWVAPPVMDGGLPVSSSRIRQALAAGRIAEAERLLGRPINNVPIGEINIWL